MWVRGLKHVAHNPHHALAQSHPMWVRGLKHVVVNHVGKVLSVAPYVGAWIETAVRGQMNKAHFESHPMWVRGLKPYKRVKEGDYCLSHPMWVRGLKRAYCVTMHPDKGVAPYVGAWIETR